MKVTFLVNKAIEKMQDPDMNMIAICMDFVYETFEEAKNEKNEFIKLMNQCMDCNRVAILHCDTAFSFIILTDRANDVINVLKQDATINSKRMSHLEDITIYGEDDRIFVEQKFHEIYDRL